MTSGTSKTRKATVPTTTPSSSTSATSISIRRKSDTKKVATERPKRQTAAKKNQETDVPNEADGDDADELLEKMSADSRQRRNR